IRRFMKGAPNTATVVKNGNNTKILVESNKRYFLKPFIEKVAVTLPLYEQETESDQLFINDGPDKLYKVRYDMKFKVVDAEKFYPFYNNFNKFFENTINEKLRAYSEEKSAAFIIKDFSKNKADIVNYLNEVLKENAVEIIDMKIKAIEPVGVRVE
ncbi:MAG: SPFH domain-containing protein, partial [Bacilli bacterium]|nr:SPFH domain-containing protein [Bacilli bacterium]